MPDQSADVLLTAFANVLRRRRIESGLSQEQLAHAADKSIRYISLLESRRHQPSLKTLHNLSFGLGMTLSEFVSEIDAEARHLGLR